MRILKLFPIRASNLISGTCITTRSDEDTETSVEITLAPVVIQDVVGEDPDIDTEFSEALHKFSGIVTRITVKYPRYSGVIQQGFALLSNALQAIRQQTPDEF